MLKTIARETPGKLGSALFVPAGALDQAGWGQEVPPGDHRQFRCFPINKRRRLFLPRIVWGCREDLEEPTNGKEKMSCQ